MTFFSVICATLMRPSLKATLESLEAQSFRDFEVIRAVDPEVNEYVSRNRAAGRAKGEALCFIDDDAVAAPDWLEKAARYFQDSKVVCVHGPLEGDMFGWGKPETRFEAKRLYVGTNILVRKDAFLAVGGFEENWGGWRADTDLGWRLEDRYGLDASAYAADVLVRHPKMMASHYIHETEIKFTRRHLAKCKELLAPLDWRIRPVIKLVEDGLDRDPRVRWILSNCRGRVLDVGSWDGAMWEGSGFDVTFLDVDRWKLHPFVQADAHGLPFPDNSFDTVAVCETLEHVEDPGKVLQECCRVAKDMVVVTVPDEYEWSLSRAPCLSREERRVRDGKPDVKTMAHDFAGVTPGCQKITDEGAHPHLWHRRWFTREQLEELLEGTGHPHQISTVRFAGWAFFTAIVKLTSGL